MFSFVILFTSSALSAIVRKNSNGFLSKAEGILCMFSFYVDSMNYFKL
jgi:hypothetical protein